MDDREKVEEALTAFHRWDGTPVTPVRMWHGLHSAISVGEIRWMLMDLVKEGKAERVSTISGPGMDGFIPLTGGQDAKAG